MVEENFDDFENIDDIEFADDLPNVGPVVNGAQMPPQQQPRPQQQQQQQSQMPERDETGRFLPKQGTPKRRPPVTPQMAMAQAAPLSNQMQMPQQQAAIQQVNPGQAPQVRFIPYEMPKRIGLLDRMTGKPIIEDEDMLRVVMAQLADIKNDLEEIKSYYG